MKHAAAQAKNLNWMGPGKKHERRCWFIGAPDRGGSLQFVAAQSVAPRRVDDQNSIFRGAASNLFAIARMLTGTAIAPCLLNVTQRPHRARSLYETHSFCADYAWIVQCRDCWLPR